MCYKENHLNYECIIHKNTIKWYVIYYHHFININSLNNKQ